MKVYYARLNVTQIQALREMPLRLWHLGSTPGFEGTALMDTDHATIDLLVRTLRGEELLKDPASSKRSLLGAELLGDEHRAAWVLEKFAAAVGGRCDDSRRQYAIDFGFGSACTLAPVTVHDLCRMFERVTHDALSQALGIELKALAAVVPPAEKRPSVGGVLSAFSRIRHFLAGARAYGQYLLVVRA